MYKDSASRAANAARCARGRKLIGTRQTELRRRYILVRIWRLKNDNSSIMQHCAAAVVVSRTCSSSRRAHTRNIDSHGIGLTSFICFFHNPAWIPEVEVVFRVDNVGA